MEKTFNEKESLELISQMIAEARNNFAKGAGNSLLFWGYIIAAIAVLNYVLLQLNVAHHIVASLWLLTIPLFFIYMYYEHRKHKSAPVKTHIDRVTGNVWIAFFTSIVILIGLINCSAVLFSNYQFYQLINPAVLILCGFALFVTAKIYKFSPYQWGAFALWTGSIICFIVNYYLPESNLHYLVLAASMLTGFVLPGHIINKKAI